MGLKLENLCNTSLARRCRGHCDPDGTCVCPAGFESTRLGFRLDDCAQPVYLYEAGLALALIFGVATIVLGVVKLRHAKHEVRLIIQCFVVASVGACAADLAGLVQGHTDVAFFVGWAVFFVGIAIGFSRFIYLFFTVSYATIGKQVHRRGLVKAMLFLNGFFLAAGFAAFPIVVIVLGDAYSPDYDVVLYNSILSWAAATVPLQLLVAIPTGFAVTSDLLRVLDAIVKHHEATGQPSDAPSVVSMRTVAFRLRLFRVIDTLVFPIVEICMATLGFGVAYYYRLPTLSYVVFVILTTFNLAVGLQIVILTYSLTVPGTPPAPERIVEAEDASLAAAVVHTDNGAER